MNTIVPADTKGSQIVLFQVKQVPCPWAGQKQKVVHKNKTTSNCIVCIMVSFLNGRLDTTTDQN